MWPGGKKILKHALIFCLLLLLFFIGFSFHHPLKNPSVLASVQPLSQDVSTQAESFITQARTDGLNYLNSKDEKAKKSAKKHLDEAEDLIKDALKKDVNCEKCYESIVKAYLSKTYFGFEKNYDDCLEWAGKGLTKFPNNKQIHFLKGYAHYNVQQFSEANKAFNNFLAMAAGDPQ